MQTALISVVTAAFVTLLIEFAAKPRLEARKDRVVEEHRRRRELLSRVHVLRTQTYGNMFLSPATFRVYEPSNLDHHRKSVESTRDEFRKLSVDIDEVRSALSRWQYKLFWESMRSIDLLLHLCVVRIQFHEHGDKELENKLPPMLDWAKLVNNFHLEASYADAALFPVSPWRWKHHRRIRRLALESRKRYQNYVTGRPDEQPNFVIVLPDDQPT